MADLIVQKVLNNNVLIGEHSSYGEVVIIGKGIGFNRKKGESIDQSHAEKTFVLKNEKEQENYLKLLPFIETDLLDTIITAIHHIKKSTGAELNEHIHVGLTDHLMFAIKRLSNGLEMKNPFLLETKALYPMEYSTAREVVTLIEEKIGVYLPEDEIGFIALHIHSAIMNKELSDVNRHSQLITSLVELIEDQLDIKIDKESIDYLRLVRHLRFTIERINAGETVEEQGNINSFLKAEYPICYNLSWKLIKVMQKFLQQPVYDAEAVYLTMHLQRLQKKKI